MIWTDDEDTSGSEESEVVEMETDDEVIPPDDHEAPPAPEPCDCEFCPKCSNRVPTVSICYDHKNMYFCACNGTCKYCGNVVGEGIAGETEACRSCDR